ncbi:MAG: hypothetical protein KZY87_18760 [Lachnospiraceae bacterium]|nr:hypothetical protein [Lachnospiraceae bacterium]HBG12876.1 hypothetical protein [Clostridium sp.]
MKLDKNWDWKNSFPLILCIAALIFANVIADRPMQGNFVGSITNSNTYPDLMGIDDLKQYLGIYPSYDENNSESYGDNYDNMNNELRSDLENSILKGKWPGFPYVQLNDRLYFSKQAVDDWFAEQSKQQLRVN